MPLMNGGAAIVESMLAQGVKTVFGLPGGQLYHLYNAYLQAGDRLQVITSRHEQGAAYMAYGYSAATGGVGVYSVVPGPGLLNTTAALLTAYGCNARVLCVSGQIPSRGLGVGAGYLHELPGQLEIVSYMTKQAERINRPADAPAAIDRAFQALNSGRPRPVEVAMCMDVMEQEEEVTVTPSGVVPAEPSPDPEAIQRAAKLLGNAKRPLIIVGGGAREAGEPLKELAEMLQAPVGAFRQGRGIVSDEHYLSFTYPGANRLWAEADVVLAIGTRLKYPLMYWGVEDLAIIRVDIDPEEVDRLHAPAVAIIGDAGEILTELANTVGQYNISRASREEELINLKSELALRFEEVQPQLSFLKVIREELPEDGIFVDEVTQTGFASWFAFPVYRPRQLITSGYQGTLGYGYATAVGVKVACPDKKVIQVSGDGGLMFNVQEIATAVANQLNLVTIVFTDGRFGNVHRDQQRHFGDNANIADSPVNPDFVALAESFGAIGLRAEGPESLRLAIRQAFKERGPVLIEVPVGRMASPWPFIGLGQVRP